MTIKPTRLFRVHEDPLYLPDPPLDPPGTNRFDDPRGEYVLRYTGLRISEEFVHPFRSNPYTCFGVFVHLVKGLSQQLA